MIHVNAHPERMIFRQHSTQLSRDSLWQEDRYPRTDAEKFDVLDRAQPRQQLLEPVVAENQGVATAQKHVTNFGVCFEIPERLLEIGVQFLLANSANDSTPRAITAVTCTTIRHQE